MKFTLYVLALCFCLMLFFPANAQRRDYLTDEEIELVRVNQQIDLRINVLTKAIDRRFLVINNDASQAKQIAKDEEKWGELPKGSRPLLLWNIERILQKAIDDIDDVAAHTKTDSEFFPKAIFKLADACQIYTPKLKTILDSSKDEKEKGSLIGALDSCSQIVEASAKVPKIPTKEELKAEKKKKKN